MPSFPRNFGALRYGNYTEQHFIAVEDEWDLLKNCRRTPVQSFSTAWNSPSDRPAELSSSVTAIKNLMSFPIFRCKTAHSEPGAIRKSWFAPYSLKPSANSEKIQLWRMVRSLVMATRVVDQELRTWRRDEECQRAVSRNIDSIDGFVAENLYREKERSLAIFIVPNIF